MRTDLPERLPANGTALLLIDENDTAIDVLFAYEMPILAGPSTLDLLPLTIYITNPFCH
jgi:hypothetical protein